MAGRYPNWWREAKRQRRQSEELRRSKTIVGRIVIFWRTYIA